MQHGLKDNTYLPYLDLKIPETRNELWNKWKEAFKWIYQNEMDNFDYFLRADDDSYFAMENLRSFLLTFNKSEDLYFGARFKFENVLKGYMSGGAGVILTKSALKKLVENFDNSNICPQKSDENDDLSLGICAKNLNITFVDTRDNLGRHRMLPWSPTSHFINGLDKEQFKYLYYPYYQNLENVSLNNY
uniref:N-acetylgalactosaminide beta-1,3-galactosyltransferase n=1 Tax=Panagrolaimus davidi TaxID=227884 RepID=A0A914NXT4_9BILA